MELKQEEEVPSRRRLGRGVEDISLFGGIISGRTHEEINQSALSANRLGVAPFLVQS